MAIANKIPNGNSYSKLKVVQRTYLEHVDPKKGHRKFYQVDVCYSQPKDMYVIEATWGRIGASGSYMIKAEGKELDDIIEPMEKVLMQKLFKKGYSVVDVKRWPTAARKADKDRFAGEDWD